MTIGIGSSFLWENDHLKIYSTIVGDTEHFGVAMSSFVRIEKPGGRVETQEQGFLGNSARSALQQVFYNSLPPRIFIIKDSDIPIAWAGIVITLTRMGVTWAVGQQPGLFPVPMGCCVALEPGLGLIVAQGDENYPTYELRTAL